MFTFVRYEGIFLFLSISSNSGNILKNNNKRIYMNLVKIIGILAIGAILGYSFSFVGKANNEESFMHDEVVIAETSLPNTTSKLKAPPMKNHPTIVAVNNVPIIKRQTSTLVNDDNALDKQHLALVEAHNELKDKYDQSRNKVSSLENKLNEFDGSEATDDEMEALVPEPFKFFLSSFRGKTRNDIYDFHKEDDDLDWGYDKKNNILDYVITHYEGTNVDLISVTCKQPRCEILVTEEQEGAWEKIMKDIYKQPWWKFSSFATTTKFNAKNELSLYIFLTE